MDMDENKHLLSTYYVTAAKLDTILCHFLTLTFVISM